MSGSLPNLVVAGVTKAGTTSLHQYLTQHPDIGSADVKEVDHYAALVEGGTSPSLADYAAHFAGCRDARWRLDCSPRYFIGGPQLVARLDGELSGPRVLLVLREPVSRLWSSYTYKRSKGRLPVGERFGDFVDRCVAVHEQGLVRSAAHATHRTLAVGMYADHLPAWLGLGPRLQILFSDRLAADPAGQTAAVCAWLGLDPAPVERFDLEVRNRTVQPRSAVLRSVAHQVNARTGSALGRGSALGTLARRGYEKVNSARSAESMQPQDRERLTRLYQPSLLALREQLLAAGRSDLPAWLEVAGAAS